MSVIQRVCETITDNIAKELQLDNSKKLVINYGLFAMIQSIISLVLCSLLGMFFGVLEAALIISIVAVVLRKYSGGAHAATPELCILIGTVVSVGGAILLAKIRWHIGIVVIMGGCIFWGAYYFIVKYAPVDSSAKPINKPEKKEMLKKKSIFVLSTYLMLVIIMIGVQTYIKHSQKMLLYITSIYLGIVWQIFTLTLLGHRCIAKIGILFNILTKKKKGENENEKNEYKSINGNC